MTVDITLLQTVLPVAIVVTGWIITHQLSLRAQRRSFQSQVCDRARLDVTSKLRSYQSWLGHLSSWIRALEFSKTAILAGIMPNFREKADEFLTLQQQSEATRAWSVALEDYQILFPETALARFRLDRRHIRILKATGPIYSDLLRLSIGVPATADIDRTFDAAKKVLSLVGDQVSLLEDLRVHLQNVTLSQTMDRMVPVRNPPDKTVPRLAKNAKGSLEVVDATGTPLDEGGATPDEIAAKILASKEEKLLPP